MDSVIQEICCFMNKKVSGHYEAKKKLSLAISLHLNNVMDDRYPSMKLNTILSGPTGTGKTELANASAEFLDVPLISVDCARLSSAGYKGNSIDEILKEQLLSHADSPDLERGILFLDEIDKLCSAGESTNSKVQFEILKIIDGCDFVIERSGIQKIISTKRMMVIAAGAFTYLRSNERGVISIGNFGNDIEDVICREALIRGGLSRELAARLHIHVELSSLSVSDMTSILKDKELPLMLHQLSFLEREIDISDEEVSEIAKKSIESGLGVRGSRSLLFSFVIGKI